MQKFSLKVLLSFCLFFAHLKNWTKLEEIVINEFKVQLDFHTSAKVFGALWDKYDGKIQFSFDSVVKSFKDCLIKWIFQLKYLQYTSL